MRLLGVDFGFKRIGLAVAETSVAVASTRPAIAACGSLKRDAQTIADLAKREEADQIVVGLPLELEGEGRMSRICRMLGGHLEELGWTVEYVDESLSSLQADANLREDELKASQRKRRIDSEAARLILERYMRETARS